jgi:hypothetical protein
MDGNFGQNYTGVRATTPPNFIKKFDRAPTANDFQNFTVGDEWEWSTPQRVYKLTSIIYVEAALSLQATWKEFTFDGTSAADEFVTDAGTAIPVLGVIDILGGANMNTAGAGNVVTINLDTSIAQPATSADGTMGLYSLGGSDFMHDYGTFNTFIGGNAGNRTLTPADAVRNTGVGFTALHALTIASDNTAVGSASLSSATTGSLNTAIGVASLTTTTTGSSNTAVGYQSLTNATTGNNNTAVGRDSLAALTTGVFNVAIGNFSSNLVTVGSDNTALGFGSLSTITTASFNTAIGHNALNQASAGTNTAVGSVALGLLTTGDSNTAVGTSAGGFLLTGGSNIIVGDLSGQSYVGAESSNIIIGNNGVVTENNTIRIGTQGAGAGQQNAAYMAGVYGSAVGGTNAFVVVDNTGKLGTTGVTPGAAIPFFGYSAATAADVSGAGVLYQLGSASALTTLYDFSGGFFPGDGLGTPASFTAPVTGYYSLSMTVSTSWADGTNASSSFYYISSGANTWYLSQQSGTPASPPGSPPYLDTASGSALINMTIGDVAVFNVVIGSVGLGAQNISVTGAAAPLYVTYVSGSRVA